MSRDLSSEVLRNVRLRAGVNLEPMDIDRVFANRHGRGPIALRCGGGVECTEQRG